VWIARPEPAKGLAIEESDQPPPSKTQGVPPKIFA
jgi:hypothetical protein